MSRVKFDFYETPPWQTQALLRRVQIAGTVLECCVGDGSLAKQLSHCQVITNDIDTNRLADFHLDATAADSWQKFPACDWVVTNPPFNCAMPILKLAHEHARFGVVMLLRLSFLEPTILRGPWLASTPPIGKSCFPAGPTNRTDRQTPLPPAGTSGTKPAPQLKS